MDHTPDTPVQYPFGIYKTRQANKGSTSMFDVNPTGMKFYLDEVERQAIRSRQPIFSSVVRRDALTMGKRFGAVLASVLLVGVAGAALLGLAA